MENFPLTNGVRTLVPAPDDYVVDFDNPQQQYALEHYLITGILGPLALVALCQRYYTKIFLSKGLQMDDAFMFLAWVASVVTQVTLLYCISIKTLCSHAWEIPLPRFLEYALLTWVVGAVFMLCNGFTKLSLLTFYLHLSHQKWFRVAVWSSIVLVSLNTFIITAMLLFNCSPVRRSFDPTVQDAKCIDIAILFIATAVFNIVTDVILFVLPIPMVLQLRMSLGLKIGAIVVFGIGTITVVTSVIRLVFLFPVLSSGDITWDAAPANIWSFLEANLFIICGSMPTLRKFFKHFMPSIMGGSSADPSSYAYNRRASVCAAGQSGNRATRRQRKQYEHFAEENELRTFSSAEGKGTPGDDTDKGRVSCVLGATVASGGADVDTDSRSDKAILQTKSFSVTYN